MEDVASLKISVEKEIKKIQYYGIVIQQHMEDEEIPKLQRVVDATIPNNVEFDGRSDRKNTKDDD